MSLIHEYCGVKKSMGHFFSNAAGFASTVNQELNRNVMTQFFMSQLEDILLMTCCFGRTVPLAISSWNIDTQLVGRILRFTSYQLFLWNFPRLSSTSPRLCKYWRRKFKVVSKTYRFIDVKPLLEISPEEFICATKAVVSIHWMCCSLHNFWMSTF